MKKLRRTVYASSSVLDSKYALTPNQVCQLLSTITQLRGNTIVAEESPEGTLQFVIGNDVYKLLDFLPASAKFPVDTDSVVPCL